MKEYELNKEEKRIVRETIKRGILHRHAQWLDEIRAILDKPFEGEENEYDKAMIITGKSRKFYKEAMEMEDFYRGSQREIGISRLYADGHITDEDLDKLPARVLENVRKYIALISLDD